MTLGATVVCLILFASICGFVIGVLVTQAWYEYRADEDHVP
jgi:hypothetical protein